MAQSPEANATNNEVIRYDLGWNAINSMLRAGRSLSGHERNCCFLGTASGRFADVSGVAGLDLADDGRVLALADWDYDGDVDFWIANRSGPQVRYLQNNLTNGTDVSQSKNFIAIRLQGVDCNRDAIGARITIEAGGKTQTQTLRAGDGYLSQSSKWLHFGVGNASTIDGVTIVWPGGKDTENKNQTLSDLKVNKRYQVRQGDEPFEWFPPFQTRELATSDLVAPAVSDRARISLLNPVPLPEISCADESGQLISLTHNDLGPRLVNIWASWCQPCLAELAEWKEHQADFNSAGLSVVLVNADSQDQLSDAEAWLQQQDIPFRNFFADEEVAARFDVIQRALLSRQRPLPVPSSFLIDANGQLRAVYKGPVPAKVILHDVQLLSADKQTLLTAATPFAGRWRMPPGGSTPLQLAVKLIEGGHGDQAQDYITTLIETNSPQLTSSLLNLRAAVLTDKKEYKQAAATYAQSLKLDPSNRQAHIELGFLLLGAGQGSAAEKHFLTVLKASPNDPDLNFKLGMSYIMQKKLDQAAIQMQRAIQLRPMPLAHWHLADIAIAKKKPAFAIRHYEQAIKLEPKLISKANNLAWLLATIDNDAARNGKRAVAVAEGFCRTIENPTAHSLDTLAAAYASAAQYKKALSTAKLAVDLAEKEGDQTLRAQIKQRIALYQQEKPFVESL